MTPVILYETRADGIWVYADGRHVATIPPEDYTHVLLMLAKVLRK